jgi:hypothetical protein
MFIMLADHHLNIVYKNKKDLYTHLRLNKICYIKKGRKMIFNYHFSIKVIILRLKMIINNQNIMWFHKKKMKFKNRIMMNLKNLLINLLGNCNMIFIHIKLELVN